MRTRASWLALGLVALLCPTPSSAYFLDSSRNFDVRLRAYAQLGIVAEGSNLDWPPGEGSYLAGDLAQERNFYNPEFDAKLTDYARYGQNVPGLSAIVPDDMKFHFAWWGFYDGVYDYLTPVWNQNRKNVQARWGQATNPGLRGLTFTDQNKNPRHIYASRNRINELYVDYTKGPVFMRIGRQAISWGESDAIALLDVQNPYDLTQAAPGFFEDTEEARIPLWTFRNTIKLVDNWKWLSTFFLDSYLVPGPIDTTVPIDPIGAGGVSFFTPNLQDPQITNISGQCFATDPATGRCITPLSNLIHVSTVSRQPENSWGNSRWGARLTGVIARDYTVQAWFFRTFNQAPVPVLKGPPGGFALGLGGGSTLIDDRGFRVATCLDSNGRQVAKAYGAGGRTPAGRPCSWATPALTVLERRLESVVGLAGTWFSPTLNGIVRTEAEYFIDEPAFIPTENLNAQAQVPNSGVQNHLVKANYLRFLIGFDRFFFFRPLNPSNSFVFISSFNGQWNTTATFTGKDFRNPNPKPGAPQQEVVTTPGKPGCDPPSNNLLLAQACLATPSKNFEDQYPVEAFFQFALQTDYLHGKLSPRLVAILDVSGLYAFAPSAVYRITDNFLASATYLLIEGNRRAGLGTFHGHDLIQLRLTYQLN